MADVILKLSSFYLPQLQNLVPNDQPLNLTLIKNSIVPAWTQESWQMFISRWQGSFLSPWKIFNHWVLVRHKTYNTSQKSFLDWLMRHIPYFFCLYSQIIGNGACSLSCEGKINLLLVNKQRLLHFFIAN